MFDQITSLDIVQRLNLLENLNVSHTSIDDDGLVAVVNHPSLTSLNLLSTNVSDNGLHHLQGEEIMTFIVLIKLFLLGLGLAFAFDFRSLIILLLLYGKPSSSQIPVL